MSHIFFTPYGDDNTSFTAANMNAPLESFDEAVVYLKNIIVTCDGDITANSINGNFSFTGAIRILFTSPIDGNLIKNVVSNAFIKMDLGDCLFVKLSGVNNTTIDLQKVKLVGGQQSFVKANTILIAYRNDVTGEIYLANTLHKIVSGGGQATERIVSLNDGVQVVAGNILCLGVNGKYALADNAQLETTLDLVMVKAAGIGEATVIETGVLTMLSDAAVGSPLYLGAAGNYTQNAPTESGKIVKCVGYVVEENIIKFKPDSLGIELV